MTYLETIEKIQGHGLTRADAVTLTFHAESFGSQSLYGVRVDTTELGICGYTYDVYGEI